MASDVISFFKIRGWEGRGVEQPAKIYPTPAKNPRCRVVATIASGGRKNVIKNTFPAGA